MAAGKNAGPIMLLFYNLGITFIPAPYAKCDLIHWASTPWEPDLGSVLRAVHGSILNGPQGTQRRLLRLAHAVQALPAPHIPDEELRTTPATATTGQPRPLRTPGHAHDHTTMPLQRSSKPAVAGLPQEDAAIIAATGQPRPVRTPLDTAYPGWLPTPDPPAGARGGLPPPHPPPIAPRGQKPSLRT